MIQIEREKLEKVLAALEDHDSWHGDKTQQAITIIEDVLAQPEQEPVATFDEVWDSIDWDKWRMEPIRELVKMIHSKTTPPASLQNEAPQRTWVGLTPKEELHAEDIQIHGVEAVIKWVEAKLKEKNT